MTKLHFKVPIETDFGTGWWYGEFDGESISRHIEVYLDRDEALIGGRDVEMLNQTLVDTGLLEGTGQAISPDEFEFIWRKYS